MDYDEIGQILSDSPELRLFASGNPALVISFLHRMYKEKANTAILEQDFIDELASYCDHLKNISIRHNNKVITFKPAKDLINHWKNRGWIREHRSERQGGYEIRLTQHSERVLNWIRDLQHREYIATESRFQAIIQQLNELVIASSQDVDVQLKYLEDEQAKLQQKIDRLKSTGQVERLDAHTIRGQFTLIEEMARLLVSDFALVEDRFHKMGQEVQAAQMQKKSQHGAVIGQIMEGDEQLRESSVGRSFFAFWRFLNARGQKEELDTLLESIFTLSEITPQQQQQSIVRRLTHHLQEAGEKVNESTRRLFAQLNRLLEEKTQEENQRVHDLMQEIKLIQAKNPHLFDDAERWMELELYPDNVRLPMELPLFVHEEVSSFTILPLEEANDSDIAVWQDLGQQFYIEEWVLEHHIEDLLETVEHISLADLLEHHPPEKGLPEVFAYIQIAMREDRHNVMFNELEEIHVSSNDLARHDAKKIDLPRVIFRRRHLEKG